MTNTENVGQNITNIIANSQDCKCYTLVQETKIKSNTRVESVNKYSSCARRQDFTELCEGLADNGPKGKV